MKINLKPDCGNSPIKALVKELTTLFACYNTDELKQYFDEHIEWCFVGDSTVKRRASFCKALENMQNNTAIELTIDSIVTHGKEAAVNGEQNLKKGEAYGFSDFYEFASTSTKKIMAITSYVVKLK